MGETAMSATTSTDMTDVDMASIAEDELSEKFSVQGVATGKTSGKTKIVSNWNRCVCHSSYVHININACLLLLCWTDVGKFRILESIRQGHVRKGDSVP